MTEKFRIQVPADGIGGTIIRSRYLAQRVTEDETRELARLLGAALNQIASRKPIVRAEPPDAPALKINRRQNADCSPSEKAIINLALELSSNPRPLSLQPWFSGRSVQWISAKLQRERAARARAQNSAPPSHKADGQPRSAERNVDEAAERLADGAGADAGRVLQAVPTRPPECSHLALDNDEGSPASALQQQIKDQVALLAEKDVEIQGLRRARDAAIEQRLLAEKGAKDQLAVKDRIINRLERAQHRAPVTQNQSWGLDPRTATKMPDTGPIRLPTKEDVMKGR